MSFKTPNSGVGWFVCSLWFATGGLVCLVLAAAAGACSSRPDTPLSQTTLRIGVSAPKTGLPRAGVTAFIHNYLVAEPLLAIGYDGRPTPRIASSWDWLDGGHTLRVRFRPDVEFHDGRRLDATLLREILSDSMSATSGISYQSITRIEIEDPETLVIRLNRREAFLLSELAGVSVVLPSDPEVSAGPYRVLPNTDGNQLAAFENYYRGQPSIDRIEVKEYQEQRSAWAALMRDEISAVHEVSPGAVDFVEAAATTVKPFSLLRPYYVQMVFNVRHPVLGRVAVRQALSQAVDRQQVIDVGLNRRGEVAQGPVWPAHWAYAAAQKSYQPNREAATLRLDAAGLSVKGPDEIGRMPSRFHFTCLTVANDARYEKIALVLQKQLYDIGVDMRIEALPGAELVQRMASGRFDAFLIEWNSGRSLAWTYIAWHSRFAPNLFYANTGYTAADSILDHIRGAVTDVETRAGVSELQQLFYDDPPAIFLAWPKIARAVSTRFAVPEEPGRDVMGSIWQWRASEAER